MFQEKNKVFINGEPYEIDKVPKFIFENREFKDFAKTHNIIIETMDDESQGGIADSSSMFASRSIYLDRT